MLSGTNDTHAELAWRKILKSRNEKHATGRIHTFRVPALNFDTENYANLINWSDTTVIEPSLTTGIPTTDIQEMIKTKKFNLLFCQYPCHTQSVERQIKVVTETSLAVCGQTSREGLIQSKLKSRMAMPKFETKNQYRKMI